ncbi:histone acetyltransferase KAT6A [Trichonephila inaurata madagascariensis]|uniref:Histone acetyltransferase KAT6A n=1 Tax=Trichonephila inaurata madagascariensis TaxID=2747483 RepID=A0A8X6YMK1_9ARAC|nr:histone acetyltransferase KAT6A [Trichonephila inaurata madagascariensis]
MLERRHGLKGTAVNEELAGARFTVVGIKKGNTILPKPPEVGKKTPFLMEFLQFPQYFAVVLGNLFNPLTMPVGELPPKQIKLDPESVCQENSSNSSEESLPSRCDYCLFTATANRKGEPEDLLICKDCGAKGTI